VANQLSHGLPASIEITSIKFWREKADKQARDEDTQAPPGISQRVSAVSHDAAPR
jgi:hypothetical protein